MDSFRKFPLRLEHLWCLTVIVGVFIFVNTHPIRPHDFWWHIAVGKEIIETKDIPEIDEYSYTASGQPYPSYNMFWLMEVFLYSIFHLGGPALTVFTQSLILTTTYTIIILICYRLTGRWRIAAIGGIVATALGLNDWNVRPQTITFLLGSICLWSIYSYRQKLDRRYLLALPFSMVIWVNSHGTFPIGLAIIGIWVVEELWVFVIDKRHGVDNFRKLYIAIGILFISCFVLFLNPRGFGIFNYLKTMGSNPIVQNLVVEWAPPAINSLHGALFFIALLLLAVIMSISARKPDLFELLTFLIFAILGISTSRGVIWFGMVVAPIYARHIYSLVDNNRHESTDNKSGETILMNGIIGVFLFLLAFITLPWFKNNLPLSPEKAGLISSETPLQATEYLIRKELPSPIFHAMSFGSYLIWGAQPSYKVFVDSRIELYPAKIWTDYLSLSNAQVDWENKLKEYGVNTLMLSPNEQAPLLIEVRKSNQWKTVFKDDAAEIFVRNDEEN